MVSITAYELRSFVAQHAATTLDRHRESRQQKGEVCYVAPYGDMTDEEINDFIISNPFLDDQTIQQLTNPGLLGFDETRANAASDWIDWFLDQVNRWANAPKWLGAELPWIPNPLEGSRTSELWVPGDSDAPIWVRATPSCLRLASELLRRGDLLSTLKWQEFEELIGVLLERDGWTVKVTQKSRDGGIDVVATRFDPTIGAIRALWQAKKYKAANRVRLHEVRELSAVRDAAMATKAIVVTTSRLTRDALAWIRRDVYRLGYLDAPLLEEWVKRNG